MWFEGPTGVAAPTPKGATQSTEPFTVLVLVSCRVSDPLRRCREDPVLPCDPEGAHEIDPQNRAGIPNKLAGKLRCGTGTRAESCGLLPTMAVRERRVQSNAPHHRGRCRRAECRGRPRCELSVPISIPGCPIPRVGRPQGPEPVPRRTGALRRSLPASQG